MSDEERRKPGAFFGRRKGRPLRDQQAVAYDAELEHYGLVLSAPAPARLPDLFDAPVDDVRLEIGFGGGEHLMFRAEENPLTGYIGIEPFINGMAKVAALLAAKPRGNMRLFNQDATFVLDWLPDASLAGIDLLYPDPWPKKRHWKRRFVSAASLDRFARVLKPDGEFRFASDIDTYVNWTLEHVDRHPAFAWKAESADDWRTPYANWPGTRYEAKAIREGRTPAYLTFTRI